MIKFVADFETTTNENDCRVWAWAACRVDDPDDLFIGNNIDDFMFWCESRRDNLTIFMHNLKFDSQFIINYLFQEGYKHIVKADDRASRTFKTMISDKGLFYGVEVIFHRRGKNIKKVTFFDSLKLLPMKVSEVAEAFHMPIKKLKIDYDARNTMAPETPLTKEEIEYITHDVKIIATALRFFLDNGLDKITIGSCALAEYKKTIGENNFKRWFPNIAIVNEFARLTYKGGVSYVNPKFAEKDVKNGIVLDKNSMYSAEMKNQLLPYGTPIYFKGEYQPDRFYPLYMQQIRCAFELKPGMLPTVQVKYGWHYGGSEYLTSSNDEEVVLTLTSVDLELFKKHYIIRNPEYIEGWKFRAAQGMFSEYIDKWTELKIKSKEEKNWGMYLISKLFLNSLYGKFGTRTERKSKIPYMKDGIVCYADSKPEKVEGAYMAVASFITSYGRSGVITAAQKIMDDYNAGRSKIQFLYMDTDSLHLLSDDFSLPEGLEIDDTKLGAWKIEGKFNKAKYLRAKCYMENMIVSEEEYNAALDGNHPYLCTKDKTGFYVRKITVAGMPEECYKNVTFRNFKFEASYEGKLQPEHVPGGVVLKSVDFTINR
jgi:hypothetical protein